MTTNPTAAPSTDPEAHSTHLDLHIPLTIEPVDTGDRCQSCWQRYGKGEWRLVLPDAYGRDRSQLDICHRCVAAITEAAKQIPDSPAPLVDYCA